jgi:hypothetical protein
MLKSILEVGEEDEIVIVCSLLHLNYHLLVKFSIFLSKSNIYHDRNFGSKNRNIYLLLRGTFLFLFCHVKYNRQEK